MFSSFMFCEVISLGTHSSINSESMWIQRWLNYYSTLYARWVPKEIVCSNISSFKRVHSFRFGYRVGVGAGGRGEAGEGSSWCREAAAEVFQSYLDY